MEWVTTSTVLQRLREGEDRQAWKHLVERFRMPVLQFARKSGLSHSDAEDVVQETFLAFAEGFRAGEYDRNKGRLSRWLFGIAFRQILRMRRSRHRAGKQQDKTGSFWKDLADEERAASQWDAEWEQALLQECIRRARTEFRSQTFQFFDLAVRHHRETADVAAELGIEVKAVYNAKHRVLKRIRELREMLEQVN